MPYPSTISAISNPQASDRLNSPSHSSIHQAENTAITEIQTFVGTISSTVGTLVYDIRSTNSNGGGHIQTANTGGTGQTTFTKGDLLVASSSSVLSKLAIGGDGNALVADSSQATGVKWTVPGGTKLAVSTTRVSVVATANETSLISVVIPSSTLGTNGAFRSTIFIPYTTVANGDVGTLTPFLNTTSIGSFPFATNATGAPSYFGKLETVVMAASVVSSQLAITTFSFNRLVSASTIPSILAQYFLAVNVGVDANTSILSGLTLKYTSGSAGSRTDTAGYLIERIV